MFANIDQKGPEAVYLYKTPGVYTITLNARAWNGTNYVTSSTTKTVTINAWSGQDRYFDQTSGNDTNNGLTPATAWKTWGKLKVWLNADNRKALIKRGDTLMITSGFVTKKSNIRMGAYGTGADPVLKIDSSFSNVRIIFLNGTGVHIENHFYSNITFDGNFATNSQTFFAYTNPTGSMNDVVFANCNFINTTYIISGEKYCTSFLVWDCNIDSKMRHGQGIYAVRAPYFSVIGGVHKGGNGHIILDHHMYINKSNHALIRWVKFGYAASRNFCLNMNCTQIYGDYTKYTLIDGCDITGTMNGIDFSNSYNDPALGQFKNVIVQNCAMHDLYGFKLRS